MRQISQVKSKLTPPHLLLVTLLHMLSFVAEVVDRKPRRLGRRKGDENRKGDTGTTLNGAQSDARSALADRGEGGSRRTQEAFKVGDEHLQTVLHTQSAA